MKKNNLFPFIVFLLSMFLGLALFSNAKAQDHDEIETKIESDKSSKKYNAEQLIDLKNHYNELFTRIVKQTGVGWDEIRFTFVENGAVNAYATLRGGVKSIVLFTGLIEFANEKFNVEDADKVVYFVMAHEIAHISLGHIKIAGGSVPVLEQEADIHAIKLLVNAGLSCDGGYIFSKALDYGETEFTTHPPSFFRAIYNKGFCEYYMDKVNKDKE